MISRRSFLSGSALGAAALRLGAASATQRLPHHFTGPYGLQLYSLRTQLQADVPGTLQQIQADGYTEVEAAGMYGLSAPEFRGHLDHAGLKCTSMHADAGRFENEFDTVLAEARTLGVEYVICSSFDWQRRNSLTAEDFRHRASQFNQWAKRLRSHRLHFGYHNHDFEFRQVSGGRGMDLLIEKTNPGLVDFEMDVFWVKRGGQDPVAYFHRFPHRFRLLHVKDMRSGTPIGDFSVGTSEEASVPLGTGILDVPAILRAAAHAGVRRYYVEDESAEAPEGIKQSLKYLKQVRL